METPNQAHLQEQQSSLLPIDIITQILLYLPPKPLARFKSVSKSFLSLINDPKFILNNIKQSLSSSSNLSLASLSQPKPHNHLHILHLHAPDSSTPPSISNLSLPFHPKTHDSDLIGSCNGILCISDFPDFLGLFNPTTRTFQKIPLGSLGVQEFRESHWVDFGFGFDEIGNDYKIVRVDQLHNVNQDEGLAPREVQVFSLKANLWKKVENFPHFLSHPKSHGNFLCNSLHWIATTSDPVVFDLTGVLWRGQLDDFVYDYVIVAFDLNLEKFRVLPLPDYEEGKKLKVPRLSAGVLGECLFVQVEHGARFKRCVDVWVMNEYGVKDSWTKLLTFRHEEIRGELLPVKTLMMSKGGDEVLMQQGKDCFWVELKTGKTRDVPMDSGLPFKFELVCGHKYTFGAVTYVEILVCLGCRDGCVESEQASNGGKQDDGGRWGDWLIAGNCCCAEAKN
ncbi:F-box protein CPR30-like isoform X1 [Chenopodium quinoa]|uniref:F-box protein CPR30-like isoform X1 n=1 Tax=Chenopodium quinoa TaxID=63459 RepID=UPI000B76B930|nr:F-box protein CPR30-like isoform X1 [Chenopodium quinoa]